MCNPWGQSFVRETLGLWPPTPAVLEVGARDVNGSVRSFCTPLARSYVGVDLEMAPGVDRVADVTRLHEQFPPASFDVVITTEMLEHVPDWPTALTEMMTVLRDEGLLILSTRAPGFPRHDYPGDFWRFSTSDLRLIFEGVGEILRLADDPTLEYACGVGVVLRKAKKVDLIAWRTRLAQAVTLYNVVACAPVTLANFSAGLPAVDAVEPYRKRIATLEQTLFDTQIESLKRREEAALLATRLAQGQNTALPDESNQQTTQRSMAQQLAQRDEALQQATAHIQKLELSLAAWQRSIFGRLATVAYRGYELARLPLRATRYVLNRQLMTKALDSFQRRWQNRPCGGMDIPVDLPQLAWLLQRLELSVAAPQVAARLGRWMTRRDVENYRQNIERLRALSEKPGQPQVIRAMDLPAPAGTAAQRLRLLFVCGEFPNPIHGGGSRVADFIKVLSEHHDVFVAAWYDRRHDHNAYVELAPYCRVLRGLSFEDLEGGCVNKLFDLIGGQPVDVVHYEWPRSLQSLDPRLGRFHLYTHMEVVSRSLWLDLQRLEPLSPEWCRRMALLLNMLGVEVLDAARADMQITVTAKDGEFLSRFCPETPYYVVNHGINLDDFALPERMSDPTTIVFTGNFTHYPNQDAVHFFMREIRPTILAAVPELRVLLVGAHPPTDIRKYHDGRGIIVTGRVPDVRPFIQQAAVCVAPLISGAGLRTKVVQYAALRRTSVVTPVATEDLDFESGRDLFVATDPHEFALRVVELLRNPARAMEMARQARAKALTLYDNRRIAEIGLGNLYRQLQAGKERP